ncbi:MAG: hypothetical protein ACJ8CB_19970 [Ktedonobacteraceae bacterium]|jgi:hypothetical protein
MFVFGIPLSFIVGTIGSYIVLLTGFYVDNAHLIPLLNQLPQITFWVLPTVIGTPFIMLSISRFVPKTVTPLPRSRMEEEHAEKEERCSASSLEEEVL